MTADARIGKWRDLFRCSGRAYGAIEEGKRHFCLSSFFFICGRFCILTSHGYRRRDIPDFCYLQSKVFLRVLFWWSGPSCIIQTAKALEVYVASEETRPPRRVDRNGSRGKHHLFAANFPQHHHIASLIVRVSTPHAIAHIHRKQAGQGNRTRSFHFCVVASGRSYWAPTESTVSIK